MERKKEGEKEEGKEGGRGRRFEKEEKRRLAAYTYQ